MTSIGPVGGALVGQFSADRERWALWLPVLLGFGIGLYFALPSEPDTAVVVVASVAAFVAYGLSRRSDRLAPVVLAMAVCLAGMTAGHLRALMVHGPMLEKRLGPVTITGIVERRDAKAGVARVRLGALEIPRLDADRIPRSVRLTVRTERDDVGPGDRVSVRGILLPPPSPSLPGGFNFRRQAYFQGLGAVGYAIGPLRLVARPDILSVGHRIARLRDGISRRIRTVLPDQTGGIAAALITGDRGSISEATFETVRHAGLAHLLAISGLHMGLVAGIVFFVVRAGLALIEPVALRHPIKKWAALAALAAAATYLVLTGGTIPTQRAFLMTGIVLLAIVFDRSAFSMRLVAIAAGAVLLWAPESLLSASFQLSFAAVVALIAAYERFGQSTRQAARGAGPVRRIGRYAGGVLVTTLIAGLATAPFAVYHFNRFALYGVAANLVAVPLVGLWVMPAAIMALVLMPFGLDAPALVAMGWGVDGVLAIARAVASWPGAAIDLPSPPFFGLLAITAGGLWLCIWRRTWRWLGVLPMAVGILSAAWVAPPHIVVDDRADLTAVLGERGDWMVSSLHRNRFARDLLQRRFGSRGAEAWRKDGTLAASRLRCDAIGCTYRVAGRLAAVSWDARAHAEDCRVAALIVSTVPVRGNCPVPAVVDRFSLWRAGAHAIWLRPNGVRIETVAQHEGDRPWTIHRPRQRSRGDKPGVQ